MTRFKPDSDVEIRQLSHGDLDEVAEVHCRAFSDRALASLGKEAVRRYYEWQLEGPHDAIALGVFCGTTLAAFCFAGIFRGALSGFLRKNRDYLTWRVVTHPWLVASPIFRQRLGLAWRIISLQAPRAVLPVTASRPSFGVLAIAVDPRLQNQGYGGRLMAIVEDTALARGFPQLHLTVATDNLQATTFYEKSGWLKALNTNGMWTGSMVKKLARGSG